MSSAVARATPQAIELTWQAQSQDAALAAGDRGPTHARLVIRNTGNEPLASGGWSIAFSCIAGVRTGPLGGGLVADNPSGTLYRLRPAAGFAGLAPGARLEVDLVHAGVVANPSQAIDGAYYAEDASPDSATPVAWDNRPLPATGLTREALFARYAALAPAAPPLLPPVFPSPLQWQAGTGTLRWQARPAVLAPPALANEADRARALLALYLPAGARRQPPLRLELGPLGAWADGRGDEAYELDVDARSGARLRARTAAGVALALASLHELLPVEPSPGASVELPALQLRDAPRFAYRGVMLDVARNFEPVPQVLRLLDLMARYKLNTLHLHLTDDEGWRLAIPGLPQLVSYGGRRGPGGADADHLPPAHGSGARLDNPYGSGAYTRADYLAILRHANGLHITVLPEIEMPGHARAAVHAMAWEAARLGAAEGAALRLDDPQDASAYRSAQGYRDNVLNPAMPGTYRFIGEVVAALVELHRAGGQPLAGLHVGGDELPAHAWEGSPAVRALMAREGLASRADVWEYFYRRVGAILASHGLRMQGWQEIALRGEGDAAPPVPAGALRALAPRAFIWDAPVGGGQGEALAARLANSGFDVVLAPAARYYLDIAQLDDGREPGHDWAGFTDLDEAFAYEPFAPGGPGGQFSGSGRGHVAGLEATLFTELVHDPARLDYMVMPRLLALAARAWSPEPGWADEADGARARGLQHEDWARFAAQLGSRVLPRLDAERTGIGYRIPPPGLRAGPEGVVANELLPGFTLRYTLDGSEPGPASAVVDGPIAQHGLVTVAAFARDGRAGPSSTVDTTVH